VTFKLPPVIFYYIVNLFDYDTLMCVNVTE